MESIVPIAGIDVAKDKSEVSILGPDNFPWGKSFVFQHSLADLKRFLIYLEEVEKHFGDKPVLVCEATGHYHRLPIHFFSNQGYQVIVLNPMQSAGLKNINIRKVKSDQTDSLRIAYVYRLRRFHSFFPLSPAIAKLKQLCHYQSQLTELLTSLKNQTTALLDQVFPGYQGIFYDTFGSASLKILSHFPSPGNLLRARFTRVMEVLKTCPGIRLKMMRDKAEKLLQKAKEALLILGADSTFDSIIRSNIALIDSFHQQLRAVETDIAALADTLPEYHLLRSIPGMGQVNATLIVSEVGSFNRFSNSRQFVAYCGIDPSVKRSGQFIGTRNAMSKRGSPMLRKALFMAALKSICQDKNGTKVNPVLFDYYHEKCKGKPKKVALGAVMHKLANIVFAVMRDQKPFELRTKEQHRQIMLTKSLQHSA